MNLPRLRLPVLLTAVAAVALAGVLIACFVVLPRSQPTASSEAVAAAKAEATAFFTLDYRSIDADLAVVQKGATGAFLSQYKAKAAQIKQGVVTAKLVSTATVAANSVAVEYQGSGQQIVIVGVDSTSTSAASSASPAPSASSSAASSTSRYRMRVTVQQVHGRWLVSSIEQVG